jgi:hypothetical protein
MPSFAHLGCVLAPREARLYSLSGICYNPHAFR